MLYTSNRKSDTAAIKSYNPTKIEPLNDPGAPQFLDEAAYKLNKEITAYKKPS